MDSSRGVIPVLMGKDRNVTLILDTSEAMTAVLGTVKNLIVQTLLAKASLRNSLFNIITFSYKVTPWSDHMVPCAPDTVYEALGWIHTLTTSPGKDLLTALTTAFSDPACQSVHLVTNSLPDNPENCLSALSTCGTRPVHTFHIAEKQALDSDTLDFLKCLTSATRGSCYRLNLNSGSTAEQVALLHSAEHQIQEPSFSENRCCRALHYNPMHAVCLSPYWGSLRNPFSATPCISARLMRGAEFYPGCRVLARREADGFYYLGTIVHQLQDRGGFFMVAFDKPGYRVDSTSELALPQPTCQPDMINITQGYGHSIVPGDTVLAPFEQEMSRYGPGRIVSGMELRDPLRGGAGNGLLVLFWNGFRTHVPNNLAVWIPASHYERIIREFQSNALFRSSCCLNHTYCNQINWTPACCMHQCLSAASALCHCPINSCLPQTSSFLRSNQENEKVEINADQQKELQGSQETQIPSPSPSSSSEDEEEKLEVTESELVSRSVNTDISCLKKAYTESQSKPAWRYWRRGAPEAHHKQPGIEARSLNVSYSWPGKPSSHTECPSSSISTVTNNSSVFDLVPVSARRGVTVREIFGWTEQPASKGVSPLAFALRKISVKQNFN
ncbi:hypothetical protein AMEX_G12235 [Astyanax mexicanus]|uniref:Si:dkey-8l13.5 n=1 Tax=Astyanax mexicanus TaxID=7994 RepID=A0A8B9L7R5_ASTMX|nr:hypothetical protein AMEX_G12235 [Astyanax mexicanus]